MIHSFTVNGTSVPVPLAVKSVQARWLQFWAPSSNKKDVLLGDKTITAAMGFPISKGTGYPCPPWDGSYPLDRIYAIVANGDVLNVLWAEW